MALRVLAVSLLILIFSTILYRKFYTAMTIKNNTLNIAFTNPWKTTVPYLQHTAIGDMVVSNQFEALVGYNDNGEFVPLGAKSWKINSNFTIFEFEIDVDKTFSNGDHLTSFDYKKSWENALTETSKSSNNSLLDILYKIKGFENFQQNKEILGLKTPNKNTLIIEFNSPYRMALEYLTGSRFSAYKKINDKFIGTGNYIINSISEDSILFKSRDPKINNINMTYLSPQNIQKKLEYAEVDVVHQSTFLNFDKNLFENKNLSVIFGNESRHRICFLNTKSGVFSKKENRKALQYLVYKYFNHNQTNESESIILSSQYYIKFQKGHMDENKVAEIIESYEIYVKEFIFETQKNPLFVYENELLPILQILKSYAIGISPQSRTIKIEEIFDLIYHPKDHDILCASASVNSGDPDGIYHLLGEKGSIATPYSVNKKVSDALEKGREILNLNELDEYYQNITRLLLEEVPVIHIGFSRSANIYRNDRVKIRTNTLRRNDGHLDIYEPK